MKIRLAKILVGVLLLAGIAVGQQYTGPMSSVRYPTNVVFISPNYTNKLPHYSSIANALSYLGNKATTQNPYVIWFDCDTAKVSDWSTQKDSLRSQYVRTGKIKIAGFFQEGVTGIVGGGGGDYVIPIPDEETQYYDLWTWNPSDTTLPAWLPFIASNFFVIDETMYSGRNVGGSGIVISNDTVISIDEPYIEEKVADAIGDAMGIEDSTHIVYDNTTEEIRANYTFKNASLIMGDSSIIRIPLENWSLGAARVLWSDAANKLHFSGNGGESSYTTIAGISDDNGILVDSGIVDYGSLAPSLRDTINWFPVFASMYIDSADGDTISGYDYQAIQGFTSGVKKNITASDSSYVIPEDGYYRVSYSIVLNGSSAAANIKLYANDIASNQISTSISTAANDTPISADNILYLSTSTIIELKIKIDDGSAIIQRGTFNLERIRD